MDFDLDLTATTHEAIPSVIRGVVLYPAVQCGSCRQSYDFGNYGYATSEDISVSAGTTGSKIACLISTINSTTWRSYKSQYST